MSTEVFNPNPTIFAPSKSRKAPHAYARPNSLWLDEGEPERDDEFEQSDNPEAINQDEIFGMLVDHARLSPYGRKGQKLVYTLCYPYFQRAFRLCEKKDTIDSRPVPHFSKVDKMAILND